MTKAFNSFTKEAGGLGRRPYRRGPLFLITLLCHALKRHAMEWVKVRLGDAQPDSYETFLALLEDLQVVPRLEAEAA